MELLEKYFGELDENVKEKLDTFCKLVADWNEKVNLISRKDVENIEGRHLLPSLAFLKIVKFKPGARVMDVGTGGGFPGLPLAICCPETEFYLVDSVGKKIKVVEDMVKALGLKNVYPMNMRVEDVGKDFDFVLGRAVTQLPKFLSWVWRKIRKDTNKHAIENGVLYLKGGELEEDLPCKGDVRLLDELFEGFDGQEKYVVHFRGSELFKLGKQGKLNLS